MDIPVDLPVNRLITTEELFDIIHLPTFILDKCTDMIENYIIQHPEDSLKWLDYMESLKNPFKGISIIHPTNEQIDRVQVPTILEDIELTEESANVLCPYCKNRLDADETIPKMTLLCGHTYHTICFQLFEHYNDATLRCLLPDCHKSMYNIIYRISRTQRKLMDRVEDVFIEAQAQRSDFKVDLKGIKKQIASTSKKYTALHNKQKEIRKSIIDKHIYEIRAIQRDINNASSVLIKSSDEYKDCIKSVRVYRKMSALIYRKYHLSLREMINLKLIKMNWRLRSVLERHGNVISKYKFGIRIFPGCNKWNR